MQTILKVLGITLRAGLLPPARWLGLLGLLVVGMVLTLPPLSAFALAWHIPALITLAGWLAMAATQVEPETYRRLLRYAAVLNDPYFRRALERRDALAFGLQRLPIENVRADVAFMIRRIDLELLPDLASRIQRHRSLVRGLEEASHSRGPLLGASPENLAALTKKAEEQKHAFEGLLTRLSDMNANLIGLTQEAAESRLEDQPKEWAEELRAYWQATAEIFGTLDAPEGGGPGQSAPTPPPPRRRGRRAAP